MTQASETRKSGKKGKNETLGPTEAEYQELVGDLDDWQVDEHLRFPTRMGIRLVVDLDGEDAALLDRAVDALDTDYVRFAKRAILDAARAAADAANAGHAANAPAPPRRATRRSPSSRVSKGPTQAGTPASAASAGA